MPSIGSLRAFVLAAGTALIGGYLSLAPFVPDFITCGILDGARNVAEGRGLVTNYITPAFLPYYQDLTRPLAYLWYPLLPVVTGALLFIIGFLQIRGDSDSFGMAQAVLTLIWTFAFQLSAGQLGWALPAEVSSSRLRQKTICMARNGRFRISLPRSPDDSHH